MEWLCKNKADVTNISDPVERTTNERLLQIQTEIAKQLVDLYSCHNEKTVPDRWKVEEYQTRYQITSIPECSQFVNAQSPDRLKPLRQTFRMQSFYLLHSWFSGFRLFFVRIGRIAYGIGHTLLPIWFGLLGLSYGVSFAIDLAIVLKHTFNIKAIKEAWRRDKSFFKPAYIRFKNAFRKGNRPYRMANDFVWFMVNVIVLFCTGPLFILFAPLINLICFIFDAGHEAFWLKRDTAKYNQLLSKIELTLVDKTKQLSSLLENTQIGNRTERDHTRFLQNDINVLNRMRADITAQKNAMIKSRAWIALWTFVLLIAMILVYFPPTTIPGIFIAASCLALISGSVFTGLGRRIYNACEPYFKKLFHSRSNLKTKHERVRTCYFGLLPKLGSNRKNRRHSWNACLCTHKPATQNKTIPTSQIHSKTTLLSSPFTGQLAHL